MTPVLPWLVGIPLLGAMTGNRTMTPIAVVCWFAWLGHMGLAHTWAFWAAKPVTVGIFTLFALGEYIGDKLPSTPNRTAIFPLVARVCFGGLCGALAATALTGSVLEGALLGGIAALAFSFVGFHLRRYLVKTRGFKDLYVALAEDFATLGVAVLAMKLITA